MAPRWDLSLLQFIVKRVVIIREDQTILERQVMMREKDLCVFHTEDFTSLLTYLSLFLFCAPGISKLKAKLARWVTMKMSNPSTTVKCEL